MKAMYTAACYYDFHPLSDNMVSSMLRRGHVLMQPACNVNAS
jgi:hypothetical protein